MSVDEVEEEEYIAESRDPTPEPAGDLPPEQVSPSHPVKKNTETERPLRKEERVPDMQLGRARFVRLHDNINYVAGAIVLRGEGDATEILLIQEAKKSCYGKWYMPAGRVEAGETLIESVKREMKEETGYDCEVDELLSLQVQGSGWYRFTFVCHITEGELKTLPDRESLAAQWFLLSDVLSTTRSMSLRGKDFLKLAKEGVAYRDAKRFPNVPPILPLNIGVRGLFVEFMILKYNMDDSQVDVLVHKSIKDDQALITHEQPFPTVEFGFEYFFAMVISKCYRHLIEEGPNVVFSPSHVVKVKCAPTPMESVEHGIQVRLACIHKKSCKKGNIKSPSRYHWIRIEDPEIKKQLYLEKDQYKPTLHML